VSREKAKTSLLSLLNPQGQVPKNEHTALDRRPQIGADGTTDYEVLRMHLYHNATPSQQARLSQSLAPHGSTPQERYEFSLRILRDEQEREKDARSLATQFDHVRASRTALNRVVFEPEKYEGKVLLSMVRLRGVMHPWAIVVCPSGSTQDQIVKSSSQLCDKAVRVIQTQGEDSRVDIRYTVKNGEPQLLDITLP